MLGGWFAAGAVVLSYSSGIVHTYYLSALAPATSALVGIGAVSLFRDARRGGLWAIPPLLALLFTAWLELALLDRSGYDAWLKTVVLFAALVAGAAVVALAVGPAWPAATRRLIATGAVVVAVAGFLAPPAAWSATTLQVRSTASSRVPGRASSPASSGPGGGFGFGRAGGPAAGGFGGGTSSSIQGALAYAQSHGAARGSR